MMLSKDIDGILADHVQPKKEMRVGVDLFIQLKKGTIANFYETGEVLGEGNSNFIFQKKKRGIRKGLESDS